MKYLSVLVASLALNMACTTAAKAPPTTPELAQYAIERTVALIDADDDMFCSAVWVSDDKLLTANHCVEAMLKDTDGDTVGLKIDYRTDRRRHGEALTIAVDPTHDLALLSAPDSGPHGHVTIAFVPPVIGQWLFFMGHPGGMEWTYLEGHVSNMHLGLTGLPASLQGPFIQVQAPTWHGNSGGPAMDSEGRLVGIASMVSGTVPDCGLFVHTDTIRVFLQANHVL